MSMTKVVDSEVDIGVAQLPGVGPISQKKLEGAGIHSIYDLLIRGSMEIAEITGMGQDKAGEAMKESWIVLDSLGKEGRRRKMTVMELWLHRKGLDRISTGSVEIDEFLKGGICMEALYEIYGEFGSGKTQFCNMMIVEAIHQLGTDVIMIDCENTFRPERIIQIALERGYAKDEDEAKDIFFDKIEYFSPPNTDELVNIVDNLSTILVEKKPKLVVLDGSIGQFRSEYLGRGTLSVRQNNLSRFMGILTNICYFFGCAIILTNQVQADPGMMFGDPIKPIGGNVVAHSSTYRLYFKKMGGKRVMRMVDSPEDAINDIPFEIGVEGIKFAKKT